MSRFWNSALSLQLLFACGAVVQASELPPNVQISYALSRGLFFQGEEPYPDQIWVWNYGDGPLTVNSVTASAGLPIRIEPSQPLPVTLGYSDYIWVDTYVQADSQGYFEGEVVVSHSAGETSFPIKIRVREPLADDSILIVAGGSPHLDHHYVNAAGTGRAPVQIGDGVGYQTERYGGEGFGYHLPVETASTG